MQAPDTDELYKQAAVLESEMLKTARDVRTSTRILQMRSPRMNVIIDRERAALYRLNASEIENALYSAYGPRHQLHHLHAGQPVPRGDGDAAEISGTTRTIFRRSISKRTTGNWYRLDSLAKVSRTWGRRASRTPGQLAVRHACPSI